MKLLLLAVLSGFVAGIQSDGSMPLTGIVRNIRGGGAPIPAATVSVTNNRTGLRTEVKTAADGTFIVPGAHPALVGLSSARLDSSRSSSTIFVSCQAGRRSFPLV